MKVAFQVFQQECGGQQEPLSTLVSRVIGGVRQKKTLDSLGSIILVKIVILLAIIT
jgi:hypothetical protein